MSTALRFAAGGLPQVPELPGGYHGRALVVDAGSGQARWFALPESVLREYIGGSGLGTWLLSEFATAGIDPLAPEAPLIFALSPLVGTPLTTSAKLAVVGKSPLTDRISDSLASSHFALALKRAGMDALVVMGARAELSVLLIDGGEISWRSAGELAGLSAAVTEAKLRDELGASWRAAAIGPAGENLVRYATLSMSGRHAGRGGLGAVLGAKLIKAVAVRGEGRVPLAEPRRVVEIAKNLSARSFGPATEKYRELGTVANLLVFNRMHVLPTRNFQVGSFPEAAAISAETLAPLREKARESCAACTIGCEHIYGFGAKGQSTRIEYESMFALGSLVGLADPDEVLAAAARCDDLGIDTISAGGTLAFAMEAGERGLLGACPDAGLIDGRPLAFGDGAGVLAALEAISNRTGFGQMLAEGSRRMAAQIGQGSEAFACHVKGLELPGYEPRGLHSMALGLAVSSRGADHNRSGAYQADFSGAIDRFGGDVLAHARLAAASEDRAALMDSLILCKFLRGVFTDFWSETAEMLAAVTGWPLAGTELEQTAQRIVLAKRAFNLREGWTPAEDTLPARFLDESLAGPEGRRVGLSRKQLEAMVAAYYEIRGRS